MCVCVCVVQVGEVRRAQEEQKAEGREGQEERRRLQVELGLLQARLDSASSQLQQARNRCPAAYDHTLCSAVYMYISIQRLLRHTGKRSTLGQLLSSLRRQGR